MSISFNCPWCGNLCAFHDKYAGRRLDVLDDSETDTNIAEFDYDELSRRTLVTLGNGANAVYEYDLGNRLTSLTNNINDGNSITFDYDSYDNVGNRLSMQIDEADTHDYTYDDIYQFTLVDYNDGNSTSYTYDDVGNRTNVNDGSPVTYTIDTDGLNQYATVGGTSYTYDDNGNLTNDGACKYYYDCENRLTDVNDISDNQVASYKYNFAGRRVSKIVYGSPDVTTKYCYDGDQVIAEYDGSDTLLRKFIYGPGIDEPILMIDAADNDAVYYYHFDGLGSVGALSNINGQIVERYSYDVFGEPTIRDGNGDEIFDSSIDNPYMFTGRRLDTETENYYYRARYYNTEIGRFLQTDPIGYDDGMNMYTYCGNNPMNWADPYGLCKGEDEWYSPGAIWDELKMIPRNVQALVQQNFNNAVRFLDNNRPAIGGYLNLTVVNPQIDPLGFPTGTNNAIDIGLNPMLFGGGSTADAGFYGYRVKPEDVDKVAGVEISAGIGIVIATGHGPYKGIFDNYKVSPLLFGVSYFESPDTNWRGITIGRGPGFGASKTRTTYDGFDTGL